MCLPPVRAGMGILKWVLREITERTHGRAPPLRTPAPAPGSPLDVGAYVPDRWLPHGPLPPRELNPGGAAPPLYAIPASKLGQLAGSSLSVRL